MRVAFLLPAEPPIRIKEYDLIKGSALELVHGLLERGVEVAVFSDVEVGSRAEKYVPELLRSHEDLDPDIKEHLVYSFLLDHAEEFDLVHNHAGPLFLMLSGRTTTPILTTVYDPPSSLELDVYRECRDRSFFVPTVSEDMVADIRAREVIAPHAEDAADRYLELYKLILELKKREEHRPWGYYKVLADEPDHKVKRIVVYPGKRLSLQRHQRRSEHWQVLYGEAVVTLDKEELKVGPGECIRIPVNTAHRMENRGDDNLAFIEVQSGDYFGEDDIERLEDDFGRS
ncbi:MAG: cupin domain-containing protein [bacterium]